MKFVNVVVFGVLAALAYGLTLYADSRAPVIVRQPESVAAALPKGEAAPDFSFKATDGKTRALSDFKGKLVVLNFWASWCPPCVKEFPALVRIARDNPEDVALIALSSDLDEAQMRAFLKKQPALPANVFVALDEQQAVTQKLFQTYKLPETLLIDAGQVIRVKIAGADWTLEELQARIRELASFAAR
jgi:cytochrome c biogenesis protein CcmG, thiol:disulfide interchange protein DsbE